MKRLRLLLIPPVILVVVLAGAATWAGRAGAKHLLTPPRRELQGYHHQILGDPVKYGLQIEKYTGPDNTPCFFVTPASQPGEAEKGRALREELERRHCTLLPWGETLGTVVLLHGHGGRKEDHLPLAIRFCAAGFRCIIPDLPAQGESLAPYDTFGKTEAPLISDVLDDAIQRFHFPASPALLFGVSQGGAIALQTAALHPERWSGVASLAAFASLDVPIHLSATSSLPHGLRFLAPLVDGGVAISTRTRAGFWPASIRPVDAAAQLHIPVFLAHGEDDVTIPATEARRIFAALPDARKSMQIVPGADHNSVLSDDSAAMFADISAFFLSAADSSQPVPSRPK